MLIGGRNNINVKLVEEISKVSPITLIEFQDILDGQVSLSSYNPKIFLFNLMDMGSEEENVLKMVVLLFGQSFGKIFFVWVLGRDQFKDLLKISWFIILIFRN